MFHDISMKMWKLEPWEISRISFNFESFASHFMKKLHKNFQEMRKTWVIEISTVPVWLDSQVV